MPSRPGKFEGEPEWAEIYYEKMLDGGADDTIWENDSPIEVWFLTEEDEQISPDLESGKVLYLAEDNYGFVWTRIVTKEEHENICSALEASYADEN